MGMAGQHQTLAALPPGKEPVTILQEARWAVGPVWTGTENFTTAVVRSPKSPARSESQYRLSYCGICNPMYVCMYMCVCMCVCMYACVYICTYVYVCIICTYVYLYVGICISMYVCTLYMYVCM